MARIPFTNMTCGIYRNGRSPPATPDVEKVSCLFRPANRHWFNTGGTSGLQYCTHVMLVGNDVDIRDSYQVNQQIQPGLGPGAYDSVYVPDKNSGVKLAVAQVSKIGTSSMNGKLVYLMRVSTVWPTNFT